MRKRLTAIAMISGVTLLSAAVWAQANDPPVGLILLASGARIVHRNHPEIAAAGGDLLFAGDRIRTRDEPATIILCPGGKTPPLTVAAGTEVTIERDRVAALRKTGRISEDFRSAGYRRWMRSPRSFQGCVIGPKVADPAAYAQKVADCAKTLGRISPRWMRAARESARHGRHDLLRSARKRAVSQPSARTCHHCRHLENQQGQDAGAG
jgi:hypothetical protein